MLYVESRFFICIIIARGVRLDNRVHPRARDTPSPLQVHCPRGVALPFGAPHCGSILPRVSISNPKTVSMVNMMLSVAWCFMSLR